MTVVNDIGTFAIFAKSPEQSVKSRLAPAVGSQHASQLATAMILDSLDLVRSISDARVVLALDGEINFPVAEEVEIWPQGEGDLGERIERILSRALRDSLWAIALGSDSPHLPKNILEKAIQELRNEKSVLGPATDGGFYLLGLRVCPKKLLFHLPWSQVTTFEATKKRLEEKDLAPAILPLFFDIDRPEDLHSLQEGLRSGKFIAPHTEKFLDER